ncbi:hypothetical protein P152DRAFT_44529 [Eremomyces bilateralis CBS 781.70]|uniref:Pectate lyase n=1 Tax=Eremomyces bilateralis CBS 781.70 TaxID=1392243 RepID=A0A6G1G2D8_9PEZI|nr:uncharacterized protein P152DRAFT_44529 [Eremomyces bilateralis CBS 781.70]KAF1812090.1 hypothetical protein P152DRAFT_44529 [Eremomyces bilateralis CBS 781.70]
MKFSLPVAVALWAAVASALPEPVELIEGPTKTQKEASLVARQAKVPPSSGVENSKTAITVKAGASFDGKNKRYERNPKVCQGQKETGEKDAMFIIEDGGSLSNVIIGASQAEGVHCRGTCTITNVWWTKVCEDAATFNQKSGTSKVIGGGAIGASDKVLQFNGKGTVEITDFYVQDYGKLIRSCGDCEGNGGPRNVVITGVTAIGKGPLCGINQNYGDTCTIKDSCQSQSKGCDIYQGVTNHKGESKKLKSNANDGKTCKVSGFKKC